MRAIRGMRSAWALGLGLGLLATSCSIKQEGAPAENGEDLSYREPAAASQLIAVGELNADVSTGTTNFFGREVPRVPADSDRAAVELGMKFRVTAATQILGVRFYKGAGNGGTHVGKLWSGSTLLASAKFTNETTTGWQSVLFSKPVNVVSGKTYIVSYYAPQGHYSADGGELKTQIRDSTGLLTTLSTGSSSVYLYGNGTRVPTSTYNGTNYYVDVIAARTTTTTPQPSPTVPPVEEESTPNLAPTTSLSAGPMTGLTAPASVTLTATATDSDGSIAKVEFYNGSVRLGEDLTAPYSFPVSSLAAGSYSFQSKAIDDKGASTMSQSVMVTVAVPPTGGTTGSTTGSTTGKTYYVTQSGAGSQDGLSPGNAWSLAMFNSSTTPAAGDAVVFSGVFTATVAPAKSGSGNGTGRITLNFSGATLNNANPRIRISSKSYLNVLGGVFGNDTGGELIAFSGQSNYVTIKDWKFIGADTGVSQFISAYYVSNLHVENNFIDNVGGFVSTGTQAAHDYTILNNYIRSSANTVQQTDMIFIGDGRTVRIQGNKIVLRAPGHQTLNSRHNDCIQTFKSGSSSNADPTDWTISYNWIELDIAPGSDGSTSWMMMENMTGTALKVYGNVLVGNEKSYSGTNGISEGYGLSGGNYYFYNNTVILRNGPGNALKFRTPGTLFARNNVGMADSDESGAPLVWTMSEGDGSSGWDYNFWYQFDSASSTQAGPNGSTSINPMFVDYANYNFALSSSSPLRGRGVALGSEYGQGIAPDATWPNPRLIPRTSWDPGAYQSSP